MLQRPPRSTLFPYTTLFRSPVCIGSTPGIREALLQFAVTVNRLVVIAPEQMNVSGGKQRLLQPRTGGCSLAQDRKSTRLNSSHEWISYAVFCLKKKKKMIIIVPVKLRHVTGCLTNCMRRRIQF